MGDYGGKSWDDGIGADSLLLFNVYFIIYSFSGVVIPQPYSLVFHLLFPYYFLLIFDFLCFYFLSVHYQEFEVCQCRFLLK